jgi:hypothetical protein
MKKGAVAIDEPASPAGVSVEAISDRILGAIWEHRLPPATKLVEEKLILAHPALPMFKRGNRLFVGISHPTNLRALD